MIEKSKDWWETFCDSEPEGCCTAGDPRHFNRLREPIIAVYTKPNCPQCDQTKRWLDRNDIPYVPLDVTTDGVIVEALKALGFQSLPVVDTGKERWSGFNPEKLKTLKG